MILTTGRGKQFASGLARALLFLLGTAKMRCRVYQRSRTGDGVTNSLSPEVRFRGFNRYIDRITYLSNHTRSTHVRSFVLKTGIIALIALLLLSTSTGSAVGLQNHQSISPDLRILGASSLPNDGTSFDNPPYVTVIASRSSEQSVAEFEWSFDIPSETDEFMVYVGEGRVISDRGFRSGPEEGTYTWDGRSNSPTLRIAVDVAGGDSGGFSGQEYAATEGWMFAPVPQLGIAWYNDRFSGWQTAVPLADKSFDRLSREVKETGVMGRWNVYLGPYTEHSQMGDGQRFRLVVPESATLAESPNGVLSALTDASDYMVGTIHNEILIFALPDPIRNGGAAHSQFGEFWVHSDSQLDSPNNVWFHEYMHTRQTYNVSSDMKWFVEASAEYHAAALSWQQNRVSHKDVIQYLTREGYDREILSEPDTWSSHHVPYYKGSSVLLALDDQIRNRTDDERWLGHVIYEMHQHEGQVTYSDFKRIVAGVVGESLDGWLDRYVTTSEAPPVDRYRSLSSPTATPQPTESGARATPNSEDEQITATGASDPPIASSPAASPIPADATPGVFNKYFVNVLVGGIAGWWVWNREENKGNERGFGYGLVISFVSVFHILFGVLGLGIYYYLAEKRSTAQEETVGV